MLKIEDDDIYAGIATSGSGGGSGGSGGIPELQILRSFGMCDVDNNVYSIEWGVEHPDLSYDTYYSTFTLEQNTDGTFNFVAGETTKDGTVVGHPHLVGWLSLYTGDITTPFALPQFSDDGETGMYSATVGEYSIEFTLETDDEAPTKINFVGGPATKDGVEVGDLTLGFWNEELN